MENKKTLSAFISLIGCPNVGKSSILNKIIGQKVSIVSDKPQTTRQRIMGVYTRDEIQLVFLDTPGAHRPQTRLGDFMVKTIKDAVSGVDVSVLVVEATSRKINEAERDLLSQCTKKKLPVLLVINKIDKLADKALILERINMWQNEFDFEEIIPLSAKTGDGVEILVEKIKAFAFEGPHFFPADTVSDQTDFLIASEIVREKLLLALNKEVPHGTAVGIEYMHTRADRDIIDIETNIYCEKNSHKGIIIGKNGSTLKYIATKAREDLEAIFDTKVNLQCWVKVEPNWRNRQGIINRFGYKD